MHIRAVIGAALVSVMCSAAPLLSLATILPLTAHAEGPLVAYRSAQCPYSAELPSGWTQQALRPAHATAGDEFIMGAGMREEAVGILCTSPTPRLGQAVWARAGRSIFSRLGFHVESVLPFGRTTVITGQRTYSSGSGHVSLLFHATLWVEGRRGWMVLAAAESGRFGEVTAVAQHIVATFKVTG
jgi:hypothetical protein